MINFMQPKDDSEDFSWTNVVEEEGGTLIQVILCVCHDRNRAAEAGRRRKMCSSVLHRQQGAGVTTRN